MVQSVNAPWQYSDPPAYGRMVVDFPWALPVSLEHNAAQRASEKFSNALIK